MSKEAVRLFIDKIEQDEELQDLVLNAFETKDPNVNLADVGREHGFEFTEEEGYEVWNELQNEDELSDFALELISGGVPLQCGKDDL
jgi:predicted ribosomally synthesized peptide with nif11-like leader